MTIAIDTNPRRSSTLAALAAWAPSGVVLMLIAAGALAVQTSRSASEPDALYFAASFDDPDGFARVVARMPHVDAPDRLGYTPLATAASFGRRDSVEMLLARGAAVDAGHPVLGTPLMLALANGHADVARLLLARGADVNAQCGGFDPLLSAVRSDAPLCLQLVLDAGADVGRARRYNPLTLAVNERGTDCLGRLLDAGVDPNLSCDDGTTPLLEAVEQRAPRALLLLLLAGADPDHAANVGVTPRALAHQRGFPHFLETCRPTERSLNE